MPKLNKQGDLVAHTGRMERTEVRTTYSDERDVIEYEATDTIATAAELRAALAEAGKVVISVEQAEDLAQYYRDDATKYAGWGKTAKAEHYKAEADRLRAALKENEQ